MAAASYIVKTNEESIESGESLLLFVAYRTKKPFWDPQHVIGDKDGLSLEDAKKILEKYLLELNKDLDSTFVDFVVTRSASTVATGSYHYKNNDIHEAGSALFTANALNEFMAQDDFEGFGSFLKAHWEQLWTQTKTYGVNWYPHSSKLYTILKSLHFYPLSRKLTKSVFVGLDALKKESVFSMLEAGTHFKRYTPVFKRFAEGLLADKPATAKEASQTIYATFGLYLSKLDKADESYNLSSIISYMGYGGLLPISRFLSDKVNSQNQANPIDAYELANYFKVNCENFSLKTFMLIMNATTLHTSFSRGGDTHKATNFLASVTKEPNAQEIFEAIVWLILTHDEYLPTLHEWATALKNGELDNILSPTLLVSIISKPANRKIAGELLTVRQLFK